MLRLNKYQFVGEIGKGTYGTIEIYKKDQIEFVVKRMVVNDSLSQVVREIEIYKKIQHPHIVSYIDHKYGGVSVLMLERGRCTLGDFITSGQYSLNMYNSWMYQILSAVDYLHHHNLIHTDLKPPNIIMFRSAPPEQEFFPKLCDLGCCQIHMADRDMSCYIQTENYRSPEIKKFIDHKAFHGTYDHKIDIWSLGIIMIDLLCHKYSYGKFNYYTVGHLERLVGFCQSNKFLNYSPEVLEVIKKCLAHDPADRWNSRMLLNHPYWKSQGVSIKWNSGDTIDLKNKNSHNSDHGLPNDQNDQNDPNGLHDSGHDSGHDTATQTTKTTQTTQTATQIAMHTATQNTQNVQNTQNAQNTQISENVKNTEVLTVVTPIKLNLNLSDDQSNLYLAKSKDIFKYPLQDRKILDLITNYYQDLPERLVIEAYYYSLKLSKRNLKINQWRLIQYCVYILSLLYFDQVPSLLSSVYQFKNRDIFLILNHSHDLILF